MVEKTKHNFVEANLKYQAIKAQIAEKKKEHGHPDLFSYAEQARRELKCYLGLEITTQQYGGTAESCALF